MDITKKYILNGIDPDLSTSDTLMNFVNDCWLETLSVIIPGQTSTQIYNQMLKIRADKLSQYGAEDATVSIIFLDQESFVRFMLRYG